MDVSAAFRLFDMKLIGSCLTYWQSRSNRLSTDFEFNL